MRTRSVSANRCSGWEHARASSSRGPPWKSACANGRKTTPAGFRFAPRPLRRGPGLIAAVLATALGVGANTAILSVIQAVLLRPLPYRDSARLVTIRERNPALEGFLAERLPVAGRNYLEWKRKARSYSGTAAMQKARFEN